MSMELLNIDSTWAGKIWLDFDTHSDTAKNLLSDGVVWQPFSVHLCWRWNHDIYSWAGTMLVRTLVGLQQFPYSLTHMAFSHP
jgi:hypothetical protein